MATPSRMMRIGKFSIDVRMIEREPKVCMQVMGMCIVIRAEDMSFVRKTIEYTAISDWFDEVPDGNIIPEYDVVVQRDDSRNVSVNFCKR